MKLYIIVITEFLLKSIFTTFSREAKKLFINMKIVSILIIYTIVIIYTVYILRLIR